MKTRHKKEKKPDMEILQISETTGKTLSLKTTEYAERNVKI